MMGKYTSLAHKYEEAELQERGGKATTSNNSVKINTINKETSTPTVPPPVEPATPLRPYAVNAVIRCIYGKARDECAVCSGYARWLIAGGAGRIEKACRNPEAVRREFWRAVL